MPIKSTKLGEDHKIIDRDVRFAFKFQQKGINNHSNYCHHFIIYYRNEAFLLKWDKNS